MPSNTLSDVQFFDLRFDSMLREGAGGKANLQWGRKVEHLAARARPESKAHGERQLHVPAIRPHLQR